MTTPPAPRITVQFSDVPGTTMTVAYVPSGNPLTPDAFTDLLVTADEMRDYCRRVAVANDWPTPTVTAHTDRVTVDWSSGEDPDSWPVLPGKHRQGTPLYVIDGDCWEVAA